MKHLISYSIVFLLQIWCGCAYKQTVVLINKPASRWSNYDFALLNTEQHDPDSMANESNVVTLGNINEHIKKLRDCDGKNKLVGPFIFNHNQVKPLFDSLYKRITGTPIMNGINVISREQMMRITNNSSSFQKKIYAAEIITPGQYMINTIESHFKKYLEYCSHGLGHAAFYGERDSMSPIDHHIIEEATAICFTKQFFTLLEPYINKKGKESEVAAFLEIKFSSDKEALPVYYLAYEIIARIKKQEGTYLKTLRYILLNHTACIRLISDFPIYSKLNANIIKSVYVTN